MEKKVVMVKNTTNGRVGIDIPDLNFRRTWEKKNAVKPVDLEVLTQMYFEGYSQREVAINLGVTEANISKKIRRIKIFLKLFLENG